MTTSGTNLNDYYFAGLFDGEGSVSLYLAKAGYINLRANVTMCDRAGVYALYLRFGGSFRDGKSQTPNGRKIYTWSVFNAEATEALEVFSKLCLVKNTVAATALPVALSMLNNPTRGVLSQEEKIARVEAAKIIAAINKPVGNRLILDSNAVNEYLKPKRFGGGKKVKLSDGRIFDSVSDAAKALGVTISAVSVAKRKGTKTAGLAVEAI